MASTDILPTVLPMKSPSKLHSDKNHLKKMVNQLYLLKVQETVVILNGHLESLQLNHSIISNQQKITH